MVGCYMLRSIDLRCRQGTGVNEPFGGIFVYLFGDICQLPPVKDPALYGQPLEDHGLQGKALVHTFEKVFILETCFRQQDIEFQKILDAVSVGCSTVSDNSYLSKRFASSAENKDDFKSALRLFSTKD